MDIEALKNDEKARSKFIEQYKPFIASSVYSIINRRVQYGVDEELSIALMGFNHAIDKFDGRGSFLSFSKLVIRNRLYDYYRANNKHINNVSLYNEDETESKSIINESIRRSAENDDILDLRAEMGELSKILEKVKIDFPTLVKCSPKHKKKRLIINEVVQFISEDAEALKFFNHTNTLPLKLIEDKLQISRKNIEPYRKYIIALVIISKSDLHYLKEYLKI